MSDAVVVNRSIGGLGNGLSKTIPPQVSKKRVLEAEFGVLVQLSFDLHEDPRDIFHHFVLLLKVRPASLVPPTTNEMRTPSSRVCSPSNALGCPFPCH